MLKYLLIILLCTINCFAFDQTKNADILLIQAENTEPIDFNQYEESIDACSWHCAAPLPIVSSSSDLADQNPNMYISKNIYDFDLKTAWVEGKSDFGIGESISFSFHTNLDVLSTTGFKIANGYVKNKNTWELNSRVNLLKMYIDGNPFCLIKLNDYYGWQSVKFNPIKLNANKSLIIKLEIVSVYQGSKYSDTAISEIEFDGTGDH